MFKTIAGALVLSMTMAGTAIAADHTVQMLNRGTEGGSMVYEPAFLKIEPGDTVTFVSANPGHNVVSIKGMLPEGVEPFRSSLSKDFTMTFETPGLYGYKCLPHYGMGMVGLIQVGDSADNLDEAAGVRHPGRAKQKFDDLLEQVSG